MRLNTIWIALTVTLNVCLWRPLSLAAPPQAANGQHKHTNALIDEQSPYLRQHAHNPVDWVAWSEAALQQAKREDKLIFLSIGYSTCHWCHVMEKECFEDEQVAALLNRDFLCIKVDREERPDVDDVYMSLAQALGGGNGWPLTVVMTPDGRPFFAGTYIPKHDRFGIRGLMTQLPIIVSQYRLGGNRLDEAVQRVERRIDLLNRPVPSVEWTIDDQQLDESCDRLLMSFDPVYGGFGASMKFPRPHQLLYLLRYYQRTGNEPALDAVRLTLDRIYNGGIFDQLGYGIHRYATDRIWKVPHFEKMLYDQAQLAMVSAECYRTSGKPRYRQMTEAIFEYVLRDLTSPEGAFFSAEDADSEGEEGKFYLWTDLELRSVLSDEQFAVVSQVFDIQPEGNWLDRATNESQTTNILYVTDAGRKVLDDASDQLRSHFEAARLALFRHRARRPRPQRDDKVLADWNGLMIASLARGGHLLGNDQYIQAAARAFEFIDGNLRDDDGRLLHCWCGGRASTFAFLDDHAFLAWAAVELYRATYDPRYLQTARQLVAAMDQHFQDEDEDGYFFTAADAQQLPIRPKKYGDMEVPSGNSVATLVLSELARLTGEPEYEQQAAKLQQLLIRVLLNSPSRATMFAVAVEYRRNPGVELVIVGDAKDADTKTMLELAEQHESQATVTILFKDIGAETDLLSEVASFTREYTQIDGRATAYVCRDRTCREPTNDTSVMLRQIGELGAD